MERRPQHISLVLGMGVLALMLRPVMAADVSKADLAKMEREVQAQNLEHKKLQAQATQISLELTRISKDMIASAKQIQNSEEKISRMESELETLRADLKKAEENFVVEDDNLIKTLSALQNLALKPTEALFVQPLTPVEIIRSAMLLREAVPYLQENAARIREDLEKIENQKNLVEKQVARIIRQKKILENEHEQMKALVQRKSKIRNAVEIKSVKAKKKVERLASQANDLRDLLNKLEKQRQEKLRRQEEERRRLAELKAAEARRAAEETKKLEEKQRADLIKFKPEVINEVGENFVKAKGHLLRPARGPVVTAYGEQMSKGVTSKGIIIKTRSQAQVISPYDGTVIFAGPFRGYGNLIIIEHGQGYLSLLAGLEEVDCELGQMLLAGEPVGQMPESGDTRLYVELRKDNHPINPLTWIEK
ncbi:MAG TPA: peptidoglycan DD-metalloendopeptidase family protein [Candidatus Scatocola faecigallinarum]|nr:peptidoglycan DD-metalloendopeptidase family protein [Candidatus Scatocola faecigallinarum]